ncbi:MAG: hypothetical protein JSS63_12170 [Bacteroidetes bacterium]|nr:hypothetical protein [Bacteroidota bacterium]MBX7045072.1 hypothetical protein [Ignavibacteria bacterium]
MENLEEILYSEDYTDKVIDYRPLLEGIDASIIVVNEANTELIAYGNTYEDIAEYISKGIVVFLPSQKELFAGFFL